jgi:hypothetical protein
LNISNNVANKPVILITQNNTQPYIIQSLPFVKQEDVQVVQPQFVPQQFKVLNTGNHQLMSAEVIINRYTSVALLN